MKFRFLLLVLAVGLFSFVSLAQKKDIRIEISLKNSNILTTSKNVPVKIMITNNSDEILNTENLGEFFLYFSRCGKEKIGDDCNISFAGVKIGSKKLKKNRAIEFDADLSDFVWINPLSSASFNKKNLFRIPKENTYFYAALRTLKTDGFRLPEDLLSNQIMVKLL